MTTTTGPTYAAYAVDASNVPEGVSTFDVSAIVSGSSLEGNESCAVLVSADGGQTFDTVAAATSTSGSNVEVSGAASANNAGSGVVVRLQLTNDNAKDKCYLHELVIGLTYAA